MYRVEKMYNKIGGVLKNVAIIQMFESVLFTLKWDKLLQFLFTLLKTGPLNSSTENIYQRKKYKV